MGNMWLYYTKYTFDLKLHEPLLRTLQLLNSLPPLFEIYHFLRVSFLYSFNRIIVIRKCYSYYKVTSHNVVNSRYPNLIILSVVVTLV